MCYTRGADKSLARPGRKQAWKKVRDVLDLNKIETRAVIKFLFLQGKEPKKIHAILTETLVCFLPGRAKDLSAPCINITHWSSNQSGSVLIIMSSIEVRALIWEEP